MKRSMNWKTVKSKDELEIVIANVILSIAFLTVSYIHTLRIVGHEAFIEGNPMAKVMIDTNPLVLLVTAPSLIVLLVYISWRVHKYAAMCVSSVLVGFTAFDLWTHIYLII